jgi:prepilin-type N-terminal cleavage/methylation domain-containing protein
VNDRGGQRGFTLLELLIALALVCTMLTIAFGGLRVAVAALSRGEDRAETHQHLRSIPFIFERAVGAAYPYRASAGEAPQIVVLFRGTADRLEMVTQAPPMRTPIPVAFTAVVIGLEREPDPALEVRQRILPNREPFSKAVLVLRDPTIRRLELAYLDANGAWQERWDGETENALPRAVRMSVSARRPGGGEEPLSLTIPLHTVMP